MEAKITINGIELTEAESTTARVALMAYMFDLTSEKYPLGNDEHGKTMTRLYKQHLQSMLNMISTGARNA